MILGFTKVCPASFTHLSAMLGSMIRINNLHPPAPPSHTAGPQSTPTHTPLVLPQQFGPLPLEAMQAIVGLVERSEIYRRA